MTSRRPPLAALLGLGGLIPFIACGVIAVTGGHDASLRGTMALLAYGAVILSFLGAVHWGLALAEPGAGNRARLAGGVVPALVGWLALLVVMFGLIELALVMLIVGFAGTMMVEAAAGRRGRLPIGYVRLRWVLTTVVVLVLVCVLAFIV